MVSQFGYIRVSTREQNEARQLLALQEFGIRPDYIFMDKQSGKNFDRPAYQLMLEKMAEGDTLVIKSIDRLGRNYKEILQEWRVLSREKQVGIVVLDMPILDTRNENDLAGTLISDIVLHLLSYVAETERDFIRQRQAEGIAAAKARGVKFGRPPLITETCFEQIADKWLSGQLNTTEACQELGLNPDCFRKRVNKLRRQRMAG